MIPDKGVWRVPHKDCCSAGDGRTPEGMPADCRARLESLKACLHQRGLRMTVQRQVVFCALLQRDHHPSAEEVRRRARRKLPDISLATVYAVLDLLEDLGEVMAVTTTAGKRYDSRRPLPHPHLICTRCHAVADLEMGTLGLGDRARAAAEEKGFRYSEYRVRVLGLCLGCQ